MTWCFLLWKGNKEKLISVLVVTRKRPMNGCSTTLGFSETFILQINWVVESSEPEKKEKSLQAGICSVTKR